MKIKQIAYDLNGIYYKKPSMVIEMPTCDFKCETETEGCDCVAKHLASMPDIEMTYEEILNAYTSSEDVTAIVFAGLEPIDSGDELVECIKYIRESGCMDDIVIYTGYYPIEEKCMNVLMQIDHFPMIVCKFGRYLASNVLTHDEVLGVTLNGDNQFGEVISATC